MVGVLPASLCALSPILINVFENRLVHGGRGRRGVLDQVA